ncbi:MAG: PrsW family glutamic-type intramembrane protease [Woeseiaceae bacterium]
MQGPVLHALLGLLPVLGFLAALVYLDSYKLTGLRWVLGAIIAGGLMALLSYPVNVAAMGVFPVEFVTYTRYVAPFIEEALKALIVLLLIRNNRVGFLVDAAIFGFAIGTGFAILENLFYLRLLPDTGLGTWIVRGFGTAIMHGGATAIFAIAAHAMLGQNPNLGLVAALPGYLMATVVHSAFNHFFFSPLLNSLIILAGLPAAFLAVFRRGEKSVAEWLGSGFDADTELLHLINSGEFSSSKIGLYLHSLKEKFEGAVVADLLCYLRLHVELSIRAKGLLMMRETGFVNRPGEETRAKLEELRYLESSIGKTGKLAMKPFLRLSGQELWKIYMLSN